MGPFVHDIDPVLADLGGVYLWWYGLSYTVGFMGLFFWLRRRRRQLGLSLDEVYSASLYLVLGVLAGGRLVEVVFYESEYYFNHPWHLPAYWLGGMATHGLIVGGVAGLWLFCRRYEKDFLSMADELTIPAAWILGVGRIGNFIDGQIVGSLTSVPWAVQFPDAEGFRHPVVLYDGMKNLLLIPLLIWLQRRRPSRGVPLAHFLFWYAFLRIFVDVFRDYRESLFGIPAGQLINILMSAAGMALLWYYRSRAEEKKAPALALESRVPLLKRIAFVVLILLCMLIPSDWTQDIPARYGKRHQGLRHSALYPPIP